MTTLNSGPALILIRHGKTALNSDADKSADKIRGWKDIPLDAEGKKDAEAIGKFAPRLHASKLYTSDLQRAAGVAQAIAKTTGLRINKSLAFRPWNLGDLQGESSQKAAPVIQQYAKRDPHEKIPGGESFEQFRDRFTSAMKPLLSEVEHSGKTIIVVSHFRDVKLTQAWLKNGTTDHEVDIDEFMKDNAPVGSALRIYRDGDKWKTEMFDPQESKMPMPGIEKPNVAAELARAKKADLVTLNVSGTNCANCEYVTKKKGKDYCENEKVEQFLPSGAAKMCCALWDRPGTKRAWE